MELLRHTVPPRTPSERLDRYLAHVFPTLSRSRVQRLILKGRVRAGETRIQRPSYPVHPGQEFLVEVPEEESSTLRPERIPLEIVHEDEFLLVVDKPAGMAVHPGAGRSSGTLANALLGYGARLSGMGGPAKPGLVHRLDKDTSGLLVVAKDDATHWKLSEQFAGRQVRRVYLAAVQGVVARDEGTVTAPIGRHPTRRTRMAVRYGEGRESVTRYKVLRRFPRATLLELVPETGRMHQLRVHLASIGHPILGDRAYGVAGGFARQALHAHRLGFRHPGLDQWVEFVSPIPKDFERDLERLAAKPLAAKPP